MGHAGTILERRYGDAGGARGALAEDDTSSRPAKRTPARVSGADARRCIFSCDGLATRASFLHLTRALPTPARLPRRSPRQQPLSGLNTAHLEVRHASFGFRDRSLPHARRLRHVPAPPPPTQTSSPPKIARARTRVFVSLLTVRSRLPQSLVGQEVVITLGDASTKQGTVCDVDRRGTVALRKVRPSGAGAPTRAPLVRGEHRDFGENVRGAQAIGKRRFAAAVVAARRGFFLERSAFWRAPSSPSEEEDTHLASSSPSPQPRPPLIRGSDATGARSHTPPSTRGPPRVSGLRTDRDPPRAPPVSVASLSEPRTRGSSRERRGFSLCCVRSIRPTRTRPIRRRARG